jgi:hypothetical protein
MPGQSKDVKISIDASKAGKLLTSIVDVKEGRPRMRISTRYADPSPGGDMQAKAPWGTLDLGEFVTVRYLPTREQLPGPKPAWAVISFDNKEALGWFINGSSATLEFHAAFTDATRPLDQKVLDLKALLVTKGMAEKLAKAIGQLEDIPIEYRHHYVNFFSSDERFISDLAMLCDAEELKSEYAAAGANSGFHGGALAGATGGGIIAACTYSLGGLVLATPVGWMIFFGAVAGGGIGHQVGKMAGATAGSLDEAKSDGFHQAFKAVSIFGAGSAGVAALTSIFLMENILTLFTDLSKEVAFKNMWGMIKSLRDTWSSIPEQVRQETKSKIIHDFTSATNVDNLMAKLIFSLVFFFISGPLERVKTTY